MEITKEALVSFEYTVRDGDENVLETTDGKEPLSYIHGFSSLVPGLEAAMEGKQVGDRFKIALRPEEAYGERREDLLKTVPKENLKGVDEVKPGMNFQAETEVGNLNFTVVEVLDDTVTVDANHPLAGHTLYFDVVVCDVREPTKEELEQIKNRLQGQGCDSCPGCDPDSEGCG